MTPSEKSNSPRRRRWKSAQDAYDAAIEVVRILDDPKAFLARVEAIEREFGNSVKAIMGGTEPR